MAKAPEEALPAEVVPCKDFVMSDRFRDWAVGEMRREVLGQVSMAGLDRMALLKAKPGAEKPGAEKPHAQGAGTTGLPGASDRRDAGQNHHSRNK